MKYFSRKIKTPSGEFDSKQEYETFLLLRQQEKDGLISGLERQKRFEIIPKLTKTVRVQLKTKVRIEERVDEQAAHYTPDFCYWKDGKFIIHEVKSKGTMLARDYPLRRKLIKKVISDHNKAVGFEEWEFLETGISNGKRKSDKANKSKAK
ncbi:MAG: DUF1064 domain-containing protein [Phocaeicola sp.]